MSAASQDGEKQKEAISRRILRGGLWVVIARCSGVGFWIIANTILGRLLSPEEFGQFIFCITLITFSSTLAVFGLDRAMLNMVPPRLADGRVRESRRLIWLGFKSVLASASIASLLVYILLRLCSWWFPAFPLPLATLPLITLIIFEVAVLQFFAETLRSIQELRYASIFGSEPTAPLINLAFLVPILMSVAGFLQMHLLTALALYAVAVATSLAGSVLVALRALKTQTADSLESTSRPSAELAQILKIGGPAAVAQLLLMAISQVDIWVAASCCTTEEVALLGTAKRTIQMVTMPITLINLSIISSISELYYQNRSGQLQWMLQCAASIAAVPAVAASVGILFFARPLLSAMYGPYYGEADSLLQIVGFGQLIVVLTGPCGYALLLTVGRRSQAIFGFAAVLAAVIAGSLSAGNYGIYGVALTCSVVVAVLNVCFWLLTRNVVGVWTHASVAVLARLYRRQTI